jgi:hypothetical protein
MVFSAIAAAPRRKLKDTDGARVGNSKKPNTTTWVARGEKMDGEFNIEWLPVLLLAPFRLIVPHNHRSV